MKKIIIISLFSLLQTFVFAEENTIIRNSEGVVTKMYLSDGSYNQINPQQFFKEILTTQPFDTYVMVKKKRNSLYYEQQYKEIKVLGGQYVFHYKDGRLELIDGEYFSIGEFDVSPSISEKEAVKLFANYLEISFSEVSHYSSEKVIIPPTRKENNEKTSPTLIYKIILYCNTGSINKIGFINAHTGEIHFVDDMRDYSSGTGQFETLYSGYRNASNQFYNNVYHLVDSTRGALIQVYQHQGSQDFNGSNYVDITDNDNYWGQSEHTYGHANHSFDVFWALQQIYDRLYQAHQINSYDNNGASINAYVNVFGMTDNACWDSDNNALLFARFSSNYQPMISTDVVAHEFGHAISRANINWHDLIGTFQAYQYDLKGFGEGISDIWGAIMEYRIKQSSANIWKHCDEPAYPNYSCMRNAENPLDSEAETQIADTYGTDSYYSYDAHIRGGVFFRWFHNLVEGATGINGLGNFYHVTGVGMDLAEQLIVKAVFEGYLNCKKTYSEIRGAFEDAAQSIGNANLLQQVKNAWYSVGVGENPSPMSISGPTSFCTTAIYSLENCPANCTVNWSTLNLGVSILSGQGTSCVTVQSLLGTWFDLKASVMNGSEVMTSIILPEIIAGCPKPRRVDLYSADGGRGYVNFTVSGNTFVVDDATDTIYTSYEMYLYKQSGSSWVQVAHFNTIYNNGVIPYYGTDGHYKMKLRGRNSCGYSGWYENYFESMDVSNRNNPFIVTYNSSNETVIVRHANPSDSQESDNSRMDFYEIQLWNAQTMIEKYTVNQSEYIIPLQGKESGLYVVRILHEGKAYTEKFFKN